MQRTETARENGQTDHSAEIQAMDSAARDLRERLFQADAAAAKKAGETGARLAGYVGGIGILALIAWLYLGSVSATNKMEDAYSSVALIMIVALVCVCAGSFHKRS